MKNGVQEIIDIAHNKGVICADDLDNIPVSRTTLAYMAQKGVLRRISRGKYVDANQILEYETFQSAAAAVPQGVLCLLSALQFHEITTQSPMEVWMAVERGKTIPKTDNIALRIVHITHEHFSCGIEEHTLQGINLRVYSPAKTVVDCFKFRNKIGIDIARQALKESVDQGKANIDDIWKHAKVCRVLNVIRPYLEMT